MDSGGVFAGFHLVLCFKRMVEDMSKTLLKKANLKWLSMIIIAIALAVIFESGFVFLTNNAAREGFERMEFQAADFEAVEFSKNSDNSFYTLANNSYFEMLDVGGIKATTINVNLSVDPSDTTTKLLFFTGKSGVVEGTFSVPLIKTEQGYKAESDFTRIDEIRIYPTEKVRTDIEFSGIVINPVSNPISNFSVIRVVLWAVSLMGICSLGLIFIRRSLGNIWLKGYFVVAMVAGLASYVATTMFSSANALGLIIVVFALIGVTVFYCVVWLIFAKLKNLESKVFAVILAVGVLMVFANAPLQSPDETSHFQRVYTMAKGDFTFNYNFEFPDSINHLIDIFPAEYINNIKDKQVSTVPIDIMRYLSEYQTEYDGRLTKTSMQITLPYVPSALLVAILGLFTDNGLLLLYAARIGGLLMFACSVYYAIKKADRYKEALVAVSLLPITLYIASSVNYDTMLISGVIVFFGIVGKNQKNIKDIIVMTIAIGLAVMIKPTYVPLVLFMFAGSLVYKYKDKNIKPVFLVLAAAAVGVLFWQATLVYAGMFNIGIPPSEGLQWVDTSAQIKYILSNPIRYAMIMAVDGYQNGFYLGEHGLFGSLDLDTVLTPILVPVSLSLTAFAVAGTDKKNYTFKDSAISGVLFILLYIITVTAFYCIWSTLGSTSILGVQVRYFIPSVFLFCVFAPAIISKFLKPFIDPKRAEQFVFFVSSFVAVVAAVEILLGYYLM